MFLKVFTRDRDDQGLAYIKNKPLEVATIDFAHREVGRVPCLEPSFHRDKGK